jgi:hypothetical protein
MNIAAQRASSLLGVYAGLLGIEHGFFEVLQGQIKPDGLLIYAIGPPCQPEAVWHACLPAITLVPNILVSGILTIIFSALVIVWAMSFVHRKYGGIILILLSILMVPVGGGFVPALIGIIGGLAGTRINTDLSWWRKRSLKKLNYLSRLWPWTAVVLIVWFPGSWILGYFFTMEMLDISFFLFLFFDIALPILIVCSAMSKDVNQQIKNESE